MPSRKQTLMLFGLAFLFSVLANIVREEAKERELARLARAVAVADSEAAHTPAPPASQGPPPLVHHPTIAAAGGAPKRAGPPMCAYQPGNEQRLGRVVSGRLGPDGVTELVTLRLEGAGAMMELPAPDSVLVDECRP